MKWQKLVLDSFQRQSQELEKVVEGLTENDLNRQPAPDCNSIGWLVWHVIRSIDRNMSPLMGEEQLWIKEKWHARFGREPDPNETGFGHTYEQAKAFKSPSAIVIIEYHREISNEVANYINHKLSESDLTREVYIPTLKVTRTVEEIIVGECWHGMHHVGQAGYVRGLLKGKGKGKGWYGR
jgi:uncharacterized damage-inducible protein DinB